MTSFLHQHARRSLSSLLCGPAAVAAAATASVSARLEEAKTPATTAPPSPEFVGVFLKKDAASKLRAQYPSKFGDVAADEPLFVVLKYNPTAEEKDAFAPLMGRTAQLQVKGYVQDEQTQAVVVAVTTETGDPIVFEASGEAPHVTLASLEGQQGLNSGYTSVLLERLRASGKLQWLLDQAETIEEWTGELPVFESKHLALFNPFPAVSASVAKPEEAQDLEGTVCVSSAYDPDTEKCVGAPAKAECGFCKFMKAGPCGKEFTAWESCLDRCKQEGLDFIEHCGKETLGLRDCVDANPEYYHVLNDPPEDEQAEEKKEEASQ
ncbi:hypothetical protein Poli38472_011005 [Pythium oligandrum]|uniref:GCK domain-containing protein n=1 Tax=Pythium oligandrum TaxID=41045 RepID=A0A8K1CEP8_PYTOL|nr:hypothetical protein Poli38472_011005 [Pythium oligandrum]|eukprot:TMW61942.1 hypothetical protein Poli38472_011005 [Pythium oligandrum]